jgi:hypothetical protein
LDDLSKYSATSSGAQSRGLRAFLVWLFLTMNYQQTKDETALLCAENTVTTNKGIHQTDIAHGMS